MDLFLHAIPVQILQHLWVRSRGVFAYDGELGEWWYARAENSSHRYAYRNIARYIRASFAQSPRLIVDYACGAGHLLSKLCAGFPGSRLMGLDGSACLLELARRRVVRLGSQATGRTTLIKTSLPDLDRARSTADLVVFAFPNLVFSHGGTPMTLAARYLGSVDLSAAEFLARASGPGECRKSEDPETLKLAMLLGRLVSLDLRRLLERGGICVRIEYAAARRQDLSKIDLMRVAFEEGSLDVDVDGLLPKLWFRVLASSLFRSRVMEDVYQQTGNEADTRGGYVITVLQSV